MQSQRLQVSKRPQLHNILRIKQPFQRYNFSLIIAKSLWLTNTDAQPPFKSSSMADCMEHCSRYMGDGEGCFGIVWIEENQNCWIRNSTTGVQNMVKKDGHYSALLVDGQMGGFDTKCPATDASVHELAGVDGMGYTMNCNKVISGFDTCFSDMPKPCLDDPYKGFFHTSTLEECLEICVNQHPLCKAVSWSPDLKIGFANCWPKSGFPDGGLQSPGPKQGSIHTATITRIDPVDSKCPEKTTYSSSNKATFDIHCGQVNSGTNMTSMHTQNVTSCMDACANYDQKCTGVVFDSALSGGYKNCYLQNTTNTVSNQASGMYAVISSGSSSSGGNSNSNSNNSDNNNTSSPSKAWIAGPVLGAIALLALLAFALFWFRRRKARSAQSAALEKDGHEFAGYQGAQPYSPNSGAGAAPGYYDAPPGVHAGQQQYDAPLMELNGQGSEARELAATEKYAHVKSTPHELPS
jgi:hypothetical protein